MSSRDPAGDAQRDLILEFLERRRSGEQLSVEDFARQHPAEGPALVSRLTEALRSFEDDPTLSPAPGLEAPGETLEIPGEDGGADPGQERGAAPAQRIDGRYEVVRLLGQGGFGKVFLVRDRFYQGELRALKTILASYSSQPEFERRFQNEIRVLRALSHKGIPQIYNDGRTREGGFYYTMAFVEGETLSEAIKKEAPLRPDRIVRLVRQMLAIIEYAHAKSVVHRDLKPANVMLLKAGSPDEEVRILDFGIAKVLRPEGDLEGAQSMNTLGGIGTPHYMSPEQIRGQDVDGRSDIYALGVIIYQMCSGLLPFTGKTDLEVATARLERPPTPLKADQTPPHLRTLVMRLLERQKEDRPDTRELHELLGGIEAGRAIPPQRHRVVVGALAVVALLVTLGSAWVYLERNPRQSSPAPSASSSEFEEGQPEPAALVASESRAVDEPVSVGSRPEVLVDRSAPTIECEPPGHTGPGGVRYLAAGDLPAALTGRILDAAPGELDPDGIELDGERLLLAPDGRFSHALAAVPDGEFSVSIRARDRAGNASRPLELRWVVDTRAPVVVLDPETPSSTPARELTLRARVEDLHPHVLRWRRNAWIEDDRVQITPSSQAGDFQQVVGLEPGPNRWFLQAEDAAGNRSRPLEVLITREEAPSEIPKVPMVARAPQVPAGFSAAAGSPVDGSGRALRVVHEASGMTLVLVPAGAASLSNGRKTFPDFYIGETEVTWAEFRRFRAGFGGGESEHPDFSFEENHPVVRVALEEAREFCRWAGMRLPTRSEWEYAARGPAGLEYPWGNTLEAGACNALLDTGDRYPRTAPSGAFPRDESWCLALDMAGNVREWCTQESGGEAVLSGGAWSSFEEGCRLSQTRKPRAERADDVGLRVFFSSESPPR